MRNVKVYYKNEQINLNWLYMILFGFVFMGFLTFMKIKEPNSWAPYGYLAVMIFLIIWTLVAIIFNYNKSIKPKREAIKYRDNVISKGKKTNGKIIDMKKTGKSYLNGKAISWHYFLKVEVDDNSIWTPEIVFNPKKLLSDDVTVYEYKDNYYVTEYKLSKNIVNDNLNVDKLKDNTKYKKSNTLKAEDICVDIVFIFAGASLTNFIWRVLINTTDIYAIIMLGSFLICGIGLMLAGVLPLLFFKSKYNLNNIGETIYFIGFYLFYYGLLIIFDYNVIKKGELLLFLLSLIFWVFGIYMIINKYKKR